MEPLALGIQIDCDRFLVAGQDCAKWLHNFCTNDIMSLALGGSVEALVLNGKGKTIGWIQVFRRPEGLQVLTPAGSGVTLLAHFERYVIREDVEFTGDHYRPFDFFLWGDLAHAKFQEQTGVSLTDGLTASAILNGQQVLATPINMIGPGILVEVNAESLSDPEAWFSSTGFSVGTGEELAWHRISHRCPKWGTDFDSDTLPQELRRDDWAISFTKGCYLGQETVARIDALGHVNRWLALVSIETPQTLTLPEDAFLGEQRVGTLTSAVGDLEKPGRQLGLAMVKRNVAKTGTILQIGGNLATVIEPLSASL